MQHKNSKGFIDTMQALQEPIFWLCKAFYKKNINSWWPQGIFFIHPLLFLQMYCPDESYLIIQSTSVIVFVLNILQVLEIFSFLCFHLMFISQSVYTHNIQ